MRKISYIIDVNLTVNSVTFFAPDFNLLNCEADNFMFTLLY